MDKLPSTFGASALNVVKSKEKLDPELVQIKVKINTKEKMHRHMSVETPSQRNYTSGEQTGTATPSKYKEEPGFKKKPGDGAFTTPAKMNFKNIEAIPEEDGDFTKTNNQQVIKGPTVNQVEKKTIDELN